jgi:hypothetical protein
MKRQKVVSTLSTHSLRGGNFVGQLSEEKQGFLFSVRCLQSLFGRRLAYHINTEAAHPETHRFVGTPTPYCPRQKFHRMALA